jgi:hypothetical protein
VRSFVAAGLLLCLTVPARAGIYSPDEPFLFELDENGYARPIQYAGGFEPIVAKFRDLGLPMSPETPDYEKRIRERRMKGPATLPPVELAGYTADLIRLNRPDEVLNLLQPIVRGSGRGSFVAYTHLARAHAGRGEWGEARDQQEMAVRRTEFPSEFARLTKPQLVWLKRVEREYYYPFLAHRSLDARRGRRDSLREDVDPLFPAAVPPKRAENPVRFVSEDGTYKAGLLAAAERKKLPPDALAIVQQLLLWHPKDPRLYWLLGELYNADGDVEAAAKILDACTYTMGYSNPVVIEHRRVLKSAADAAAAARAAEASKAREESEAEEARMEEERARQEQADRDYQKRFWWIVSIGVAVGVLLVYYQFREVARRLRRSGREA